MPNLQPAFNKKIKDEDAFYKSLAYKGMIEMDRIKEPDVA